MEDGWRRNDGQNDTNWICDPAPFRLTPNTYRMEEETLRISENFIDNEPWLKSALHEFIQKRKKPKTYLSRWKHINGGYLLS